jgi:predicted metal-binding protein
VSETDFDPAEIDEIGCREPDGAGVTIIVCETCRDPSDPDREPRPGALLAEATRLAASGSRLKVFRTACLGTCQRGLGAAIGRDGCYTYVFGNLDVGCGADLVAAAKLFSTSDNALLPWRGRPERLKRGMVARLPPADLVTPLHAEASEESP